MKNALLAALLLLLPGLTGCLRHTRSVLRVISPNQVMNATADQLITQINAQYEALHSLNASVEITASVGGGSTGNVTDYTSVNGYVLIKKPGMLRVILLVPVLHTRLIDMVSDDSGFKMLIPPQSRAIVGSDTVTVPSKKPLENLRPDVFLESMLIQGVGPDDLVSLTSDVHVEVPAKAKYPLEVPDYDLTITRRTGKSNELQTLRVIHFDRTNLLPYKQDIYDKDGRRATVATYDNYQKFGDVQFPTLINMSRPLDEYAIKMVIDKLSTNQELGDDQFQLKIPDNVTIQKMQ